MSDEKRGKSSGLRPWHVIVGILGLLIILIVLWVIVQRSSVKRQIASLRAQGYPTSYVELYEQNRLSDGVKNAADIYGQAFDAFYKPIDDANTPYVGKAKVPPRGEPLQEAMVGAIKQLLTDNEGCLRLLREAGQIEHCRYDWDYETGGIPFMTPMRNCAQLLTTAIILNAHEGNTTVVLDSFHDEMKLAQSLRNEPGLTSYLVGIACSALSLRALEQSLSVTTFTDEQLVEMSRILDKNAAAIDLKRALINERAMIIESFRQSNPPTVGSPRPSLPNIPFLRHFGLPDMLDYLADLIEITDLAPEERLKRSQAKKGEIDNLSALHVYVKMFAPANNRIVELDVRLDMDLDLARCALAIERYRLANGATPEHLAALVPDYLDQVPIDPFDAQPIRYLRDGHSYRLYSVFEDGQDQNGQTRDEVNQSDPYDWAFIVVK